MEEKGNNNFHYRQLSNLIGKQENKRVFKSEFELSFLPLIGKDGEDLHSHYYNMKKTWVKWKPMLLFFFSFTNQRNYFISKNVNPEIWEATGKSRKPQPKSISGRDASIVSLAEHLNGNFANFWRVSGD